MEEGSQLNQTAGEQHDDARPRLLFFYAPASGQCRRVEGFLAQVLQRGHNHETFRLQRIRSDEHPDLVERLRVKSVPTLVVIDGESARRLKRPQGCRAIEDFLAPWLRRSGRPGRAPGAQQERVH